jgi:SAM-dependent methyltransferase
MIRFISKYFVKKTDIDQLTKSSLYSGDKELRGLDFGCGIGRGVFLMDDFDIDAYGIDISDYALKQARKIAVHRGRKKLDSHFELYDGLSELPYSNGYFDMIVSHGVFDSMPFEIARINMLKLSQVIKSGGYFYLDLISDDSNHPEGFDGEEIVKTMHEKDTIQSYFTMEKLKRMILGTGFVIEEVIKRRAEDVMTQNYHSRLHIVLKKS